MQNNVAGDTEYRMHSDERIQSIISEMYVAEYYGQCFIYTMHATHGSKMVILLRVTIANDVDIPIHTNITSLSSKKIITVIRQLILSECSVN